MSDLALAKNPTEYKQSLVDAVELWQYLTDNPTANKEYALTELGKSYYLDCPLCGFARYTDSTEYFRADYERKDNSTHYCHSCPLADLWGGKPQQSKVRLCETARDSPYSGWTDHDDNDVEDTAMYAGEVVSLLQTRLKQIGE